MKWTTRGVATVVAILALGACGDDGDSGGDDPKPSSGDETTSEAPPATYGSVEELKNAAVDAGYNCPNWKADNKVTLAAESGHCSGSDVFATYASPGDLQSQLDTDKDLDQMLVDAGIDPDIHLVGENWSIRGVDAEVRPLQEHLGGTIVDAQ